MEMAERKKSEKASMVTQYWLGMFTCACCIVDSVQWRFLIHESYLLILSQLSQAVNKCATIRRAVAWGQILTVKFVSHVLLYMIHVTVLKNLHFLKLSLPCVLEVKQWR